MATAAEDAEGHNGLILKALQQRIALAAPDVETSQLCGALAGPYKYGIDGFKRQIPGHLLAVSAVPTATSKGNAADTTADSNSLYQRIAESLPKDSLAARVRSKLAEYASSGVSGITGGIPGMRERRWILSWEDRDGLLRYKGNVYIPSGDRLKLELLRDHHDDPLAGHFGVHRTHELLQRQFYWPSMMGFIRDYCWTCDIYQRAKAPRHKAYGKLESLPIPGRPWTDIAMDFITDLPASKRRHGSTVYDSILVIVDRFTKAAHYIPVRKTIDAPELAEVFIEAVIRLHGVPKSIVMDRGSVFTSRFWASLCYYMETRRALSTSFHPQTDGQTERQNQTLEQYLRAYINY
jgi:hypothetical protein